jgi:cyclopropane fatty-acyl-phospholipid synthase-like methyltransferase
MDPKPQTYWNNAGAVGYGEAMFAAKAVEQHINSRLWNIALDIAKGLGLDAGASVLDLGCGDGAFANQVLAKNFAAVDGFDLSENGILRATANASGPHVRFSQCDITKLEFAEFRQYDAAFLIGILHHVKEASPLLIKALRRIAPRVVVLEPNGDHLMRRLLEFTPSYRAAGEASFGTRRLRVMFEEAGYRCATWQRLNLFPNFTPLPVFRLLEPLESVIERTPVLRALCTVNMYGFETSETRHTG